MAERRRFTPELKRQTVQPLNAGQRPASVVAGNLTFSVIDATNGKKMWRPMVGPFRGPVGKPNRPQNWPISSAN